MQKRSLTAIGLLLAVVFGLGLFFGVVLPRLFGRRSTPQVYNTATIIKQVQTLSQLVTVKYVMEKIEILEDPPKSWFGSTLPQSWAWDRVILVAHGVVNAGVDLSQLKPGDIEISDRKIILRLPPARITDAYLDEKKTQVVEHTTGLLRALNKDLETTTRQNALDDIRVAARSNGITKDADERARTQLTHLFEVLGFTQVDFRSP